MLYQEPGTPFRQYPYVIESLLGVGHSGEVYAVRHKFTGDRFALKLSHLPLVMDAKKIARALAEARAAYGLRHHNVVRVVDLACEDDGQVWQLMELLEGRTLADVLSRFGRLSPLYAIDVALEVASEMTGRSHEAACSGLPSDRRRELDWVMNRVAAARRPGPPRAGPQSDCFWSAFTFFSAT